MSSSSIARCTITSHSIFQHDISVNAPSTPHQPATPTRWLAPIIEEELRGRRHHAKSAGMPTSRRQQHRRRLRLTRRKAAVRRARDSTHIGFAGASFFTQAGFPAALGAPSIMPKMAMTSARRVSTHDYHTRAASFSARRLDGQDVVD